LRVGVGSTPYNLTHSFQPLLATSPTPSERQAVWHYAHRIRGVFHEDYRYENMNAYLVGDSNDHKVLSPTLWATTIHYTLYPSILCPPPWATTL
jgi:hypothetical protein